MSSYAETAQYAQARRMPKPHSMHKRVICSHKDITANYQFYQAMRSTYCINSVSSCNQINRSPINSSPSKQLYSFSKDPRFKSEKSYCDNIYNLPNTFRQSPSRLALSRSSSKRSINYLEQGNRFDSRVVNVLPSYSLRKRTKVIDKNMSIQPLNDNPGAGAYENPEALSPRGSYFVSKHQSTGHTLFNPRRSQRFFEFKNINPGPGNYNQINKTNDSGCYPLSNTYGGGKRFFDKQRRVAKFQQCARVDYNPGPGSYRSSSDFGHYDGNVYNWNAGISYVQPTTMRGKRMTSRTRF